MSRFFWFANVLFRLSCNSPLDYPLSAVDWKGHCCDRALTGVGMGQAKGQVTAR